MTGLDCNILVQLAMADHPAHLATTAASEAASEAELRSGSSFIFPSLVLTEFLHVVTDSKRLDPPLHMSDALGWVQDLLTRPGFQQIEPTSRSLRQTLHWMRQFQLGRKRILDTHLAAVLHTSGVRRLFTSNPDDFAVFRSFDLITP
jgi:predicted nucleic acid-binding protein